MKKYNIAIVGATGLVGRTFLKVLEEYDFPINELRLLASSRSKGKEIIFKNKTYIVDELIKDSFAGIDVALFSAGGSISKEYAPYAVKSGAYVIDNSSAWRMDENCALVVPEINMEDILGKSKIIANPNCSTIQSVIPLQVLRDNFGLKRVVYTTYQAVAGSGQKGIDDLFNTLDGNEPKFYPHNISKTCIPEIDVFMDDGYTKEEIKMIEETRKILHLKDLAVSATCIRVPVEICHGVVIEAELEKNFTLDEVRKVLNEHESIVVFDDGKNHIYPTSSVAKGTDKVYVGRIRYDKSRENSVLLYCVADNIRKGAASNAVQILERLVRING